MSPDRRPSDPAQPAAPDSAADRLRSERPVPPVGFRAELRARLLSDDRWPAGAPARIRMLVTAYVGSGALLIAVAAIGLAGAGPFAA